jgi:uncharacterized protein YukE
VPTYDWDLVGGDPAPGDPDAYADLSGALGETASNAEEAHGRLKKLKDNVDESIWRGKAADAFREEIDKLPDHLAKLMTSYQAAADAMATYGRTLRALQQEAATEVGRAQTARDDEQSATAARDTAVAADPTVPTTVHDAAADAARSRLRAARDQIDDIRDRRRQAETTAVDGLEHAHDVGMKNRSTFHKILGAIASVAETVAFVLAVVGIAIVVCVLLTNPAGWAALVAAFGAASAWFTAATVASGVALGVKTLAWSTGDEEITGKELATDAAWFFGSLAAGQAAGAIGKSMNIGARSVQVTTGQFTRTVTEVRPVLRLITATDDIVLMEARVSTTIVRITQIRPIVIPANLGAMWDAGASWVKDIPDYLDKNPALDRVVGGRPDEGEPLDEVLGRDVSCTCVHTRIAEPEPAR